LTVADGSPSPKGEPGRYLFEALVAFLHDDGWPVAVEDEQERAVAVPVEGDSGRWVCAGQILTDRPLLLFSSIVPTYVPPAARARVGEFVNRANVGLLFGGFQYDLDEGEIRFVNSLDFNGVDPAPVAGSPLLRGLIRQMVQANVSTVDQYLSALMAVVHGGADPAEAVAGAESDEEPGPAEG
jgi:hypothetical protein